MAAAMWLTTVVLVPVRAARDRTWFRAELRVPSTLSIVAATAVLGTRLAMLGWAAPGGLLLISALTLWGVLIGPVLAHWRTPTVGASLLLVVATQSIAVLAAVVALRTRMVWLEFAALVPFGLGTGSYVFVLAPFDLRQLTVGRGDHWITGGALAISALAAAEIAMGTRALAVLGRGHAALEVLAVGMWAASLAWLPVLLLGELLRPRLGYDVRRWATVFPLGMYAACSFMIGRIAHASPITTFARVWSWVALAVWAVMFVVGIAGECLRTRTTRDNAFGIR